MLASVALTLTSLALGTHATGITPDNIIATSLSGALSALKYSNVGGSGSYNQVTNMVAGVWPSCTANPSCITAPKAVSGPLAPFDEDMTFVFRGPMTLYNIAVYQPSNSSGATWKQVSSWAANQQPDNMVFMNNMGGGASGEWTICGGSSQSYAAGDWASAAASPNAQVYSGNLPSGKEINIMTSTSCQDGSCDGFFHGTANEGWAGSKMFVVDFDMPQDASSLPAIWALNGQVVRAAQYGCNCRGMGGDGGCGEIDIAETLVANSPQAISEIYSFKGATGTGDGNFFARPANGRASIAVIFDVKTDAIGIYRLTDFDYTQSQITRSIIDGYLNAPSKAIPFGTSKRSQASRRSLFNHRRQH